MSSKDTSYPGQAKEKTRTPHMRIKGKSKLKNKGKAGSIGSRTPHISPKGKSKYRSKGKASRPSAEANPLAQPVGGKF